ncbi:MAG TPA: hypothetical protein VFN64_12250 [Burkholderiaceae bacterium]|nr:hypothetical protein [Burkholderiaceae bacterium]
MVFSNGPIRARWLACGILMLPAVVYAQASSYADEYMKRLKLYQTVEPYGDTPFGESIDLYTGQVTFNQTDVVLEGTGPTIRIGRSRSSTGYDTQGMESAPAHYFGDWTMDLPRIDTLVAAQRYTLGTPGTNWRMSVSSTDPASFLRCTNFRSPYVGQSGIVLEDWWRGYELVLGDGSSQPLLVRAAGYIGKPAISAAFPVVTLSTLQMTCLPATKNGTPGEGFLAYAPDGTKIWFDWLVGSLYSPVNMPLLETMQAGGSVASETDPSAEPAPADGEASPSAVPGGGGIAVQERMQVSMFATRVEDRFGNWVVYNYTPDTAQLTSITASDGRKVTLAWTGAQVTSVTAMPGTPDARTWTYGYTGSKLTTVTQPDLSKWTFDLKRTGEGAPEPVSVSSCSHRSDPNTPTTGGELSTITAPSGLVGTFLMQMRWHGRSYTGSYCDTDTSGSREMVPPMFSNLSLYERTLNGPGVPLAKWRYLYAPAAASTIYDACALAGTCPDTTWVDVVEPDGSKTRYTSSTRYDAVEGKPVKTETFSPTNQLLRTETTTYQLPAGTPYVARLGSSLLGYRVNETKSENLAPVRKRVVTQQQRSFTWEVAADCGTGATLCFDAWGRPTKVTKTSAPAP